MSQAQQPASIRDVVATTLQGLGRPIDATAMSRSIMLRDGFFTGHKMTFPGGYAICLADETQIAIYESNGTHIATVSTTGREFRRAA